MKLTLRTTTEDYISTPCEVLPVFKESGMRLYVYFHLDTTDKREEILIGIPQDIIEDTTVYCEDLLCLTLTIPIKGYKVLIHE